ncbi:MAG: hypothetical protein AAF772_09255 [Acidobacteriota bacterium]
MTEPVIRLQTLEAEVATDPDTTLRIVGEIAEVWGGEFRPLGRSGGTLTLPVLSGVHRGLVEGPLTLAEGKPFVRLAYMPNVLEYRVRPAPVMFLLLGALGAVVTTVGLFIPALLPLMPIGITIAAATWLFVVARLQNHGPDEFFDQLEQACEEAAT